MSRFMQFLFTSTLAISVAGAIAEERPYFDNVKRGFNPEKHDCEDIVTSPNQCAVKVSRALIAAGLKLDDKYEGKLCRHGYARGAQDLAAFLKKKWGERDIGVDAPGKMPESIRGKKGIIVFMNIPGFDGQGHIDLWVGDKTQTSGGEYWNAKPIWFWELK